MANAIARRLRKQLTPQEVKLWVQLRGMRPLGYHFRRQAPIERYIVDFVCFSRRLVIEVDGSQHGYAQGFERDMRRDAFLSAQGLHVLRFWNSDIDRNLDGVMDTIIAALKTPTPPG
jgi:very-short-patch-repair endonuclease